MKAVKEYVIFYLIDREDQSEYSTLTGQRALDTNLWLNKPWAKLKKKKKKADWEKLYIHSTRLFCKLKLNTVSHNRMICHKTFDLAS